MEQDMSHSVSLALVFKTLDEAYPTNTYYIGYE